MLLRVIFSWHQRWFCFVFCFVVICLLANTFFLIKQENKTFSICFSCIYLKGYADWLLWSWSMDRREVHPVNPIPLSWVTETHGGPACPPGPKDRWFCVTQMEGAQPPALKTALESSADASSTVLRATSLHRPLWPLVESHRTGSRGIRPFTGVLRTQQCLLGGFS